MYPVMHYRTYRAVVTRYYHPSEIHYGTHPRQPWWKRWMANIKKWFSKPTQRSIKIR